MANYFNLKNDQILNPPANTNLGSNTGSYSNVYIENTLVLGNVAVTEASIGAPKVSNIDYPDNDTAANTAGGQTITLNGSGFLPGASVLINGVTVSVVSVVNSTQITFTSPANAAGSYILYVINTDGSTAISIPGIQYSGTPNWTTPAGTLGTVYETASINQTLVANGDAPITYSVLSGTLPPGSTLNSNGTLSGTTQATASSTTYTFTVRATDNELQDTDRSFSLTINPDLVTWVNPSSGATLEVSAEAPISNIVLNATSAAGANVSYTANALPTGLSLSGNTISGTPTVVGNTSTLLTATASTTRSSNNTISWVVVLSGDSQFRNVTTLLNPELSVLPFNDDASTNNFPITVFGDTRPNNFGPYTPGYYSNFFDGSGDHLAIPNNTAFAFGAGSLTVEAWINTGVRTDFQSIIGTFDGGSNAWYIHTNASGTITYGLSASAPYVASVQVCDNNWHHVAMVRNGASDLRLYVDGVLADSRTDSSQPTPAAEIRIGSLSSGATRFFTGYISNARVVKGTAVYTANFTPSATPLTAITNTSLLTCQSNRFIDNSTNNFAVTRNGDTRIDGFDPFVIPAEFAGRGSTYFSTTTSFLRAGLNAVSTRAAFTIEGWIYVNTMSGLAIFSAWATAPGSQGSMMYFNEFNNDLYLGDALINTIQFSANLLPRASWVHIAVTFDGTTYRVFINGVSVASSTTLLRDTAMNGIDIGARGGTGPMTGAGNMYASNFRVIKGTALYTTNFTPPTAPLTAVANTSLLTCQSNQPHNNNQFLDSSTGNFLVTRNGNPTQGSFSPYGGGWSNYFDGTGDHLTIPSNAAFNFSTEDLTIECWIYPTAFNSFNYWYSNGDSSVTALKAMYQSNGLQGISIGNWGGADLYFTGASVQLNVWNHIAITRQSGTWRGFVNGVLAGSSTTSLTIPSGQQSYIGTAPNFTANATGYISNFRIVKGTAVYTATFTPPTAPLIPITGTSLLTCADNRFIDDSINNFAITRNGDVRVEKFNPFGIQTAMTPTSHSAYFDGTGDWLTTPYNSAYAFGTGDFTVEFWVNHSSFDNYEMYIGDVSMSTGRSVWGIGSTSALEGGSNKLYFFAGTSLTTYGATWTPLTNTWYHIAASRSGTLLKLFVNGTQLGSTFTCADNIDNTYGSGTFYIGRVNSSPDWRLNGYISNMRVVKGTALYTANFTPSTTPLTAVANTSLLTCQNSTFVDNSTNRFVITSAGDARPVPTNPFGFTAGTRTNYTPAVYGGSMSFDGSGDFLTVPDNAALQMGSGDFTVEFWINFSSIASYQTPFDKGYTGAGALAFQTGLGNGRMVIYASGSAAITESGTAPTGTWIHYALVRRGTTLTLYRDGVASGSATNSTNFNNSSQLGIGANAVAPPGGSIGMYAINGYISDLRITKGTALYSSNFVPPVAPVQPTANTTLLLNGTGAAIYDASTLNNLETVGDARNVTNVVRYGNTSMFFDGTGDGLIMPSSINFDLPTNFTIEMWLNLSDLLSDWQAIISRAYAVTGGWRLYKTTGANQLRWYVGSANPVGTTGSTMVNNTWSHVAVVRNGSTVTIYIDGVNRGSGTDATNLSPGNYALEIGRGVVTSEYPMTGYIQDLRITKGVARYTANFTPPTAAFPTK
jgi:hypothetical protein